MKKMLEVQEIHLEESLTNFQMLLSNIREVVFQCDSMGIFVYVNDAWERLTGFPSLETVGKNILQFLLTEELKGISSHIKSKELCEEFYFLTKNKKIKMFELHLKPFFDQNGKMNGYIGSMHDVTAAKEEELLMKAGKQYVESLNKNLQKRIQEEVAKNRKKDHLLIEQSRIMAMAEMISTIGNQWRQPLTSLSLMIQDTRQAFEFGEMNELYIDQFIKESMTQIQSMLQTINDFRKFYRPTKEKNSFSLGDCIEDALTIFSSNLRKHEIYVDFEYGGQQIVYGSPNELSQVILHVLTLARDAFIVHNIKNRSIKISIHENDSSYLIQISDNTGGLHPALLSKVFEPYTSTSRHGSGIGLYMAKIILNEMNGSIKLKNTEAGLCTSVTIPKTTACSAQIPTFA